MAPIQSKGVEQDELVMPVIDFGAFLSGHSKQETGAAIAAAFKDSGFFYLSNHGISESSISSAFAHSAKFFARPQVQKDELAWTDPVSNRGYVSKGREKLADDPNDSSALRSTAPDLKENMEIGREGVDEKPNKWPEHFDADGTAFTTFMKEFFTAMQELHLKVMSAIAIGMGLDDEQFFTQYSNKAENNLRLLHYPPVKKNVFLENPNQVRAGAHSDYGSITLLLQDSAGGLEVSSPKGTWVRAAPIPGTIVVNAGDLLSRWSNDQIKSTQHRVVQPPPSKGELEELRSDSEDTFPPRYSIAYFCIPNSEAWIEALPGTWEKDAVGKKYPGIESGRYQVQRLEETYG